MHCNCCKEQRDKLHVRDSILLQGQKWTLCSECLKHEPRFAIILAGIQNGLLSVAPFIKKRLHHGDEIKAREILK